MGSGTGGASRIGCVLLIIAGAAGGLTFGQELSTDVLPSEEELLEALRLGEIDYDRYEQLLDLHLHGIDSTNLYLLNEIPGLWEIGDRSPDTADELADDQRAPFFRPPSGKRRPKVRADYRRQQRLTDTEDWGQRFTLRLVPGPAWSAELAARRDTDGSCHLRSRSITFQSRGSALEQVTVGDFTERYGLGAVIGHRGRILAEGKGSDGEALLFPNSGRCNGLAFRGAVGGVPIRSLLSIQQDTSYTLRTAGLQVQLARRYGSPTVVVAASQLGERRGEGTIEDYKVALNLGRVRRDGVTRGELCFQAGERPGFGAALWEGMFRTGRDRISYAAWWYDDHYLDLTGGGRAATLRHTIALTEIDFDLATRRTGQKGMLISSSSQVDPHTRFDLTVMAAALNRDTANGQLLGALTRRLSGQLTARCDYLVDTKVRDGFERIREGTSHRWRTEARWKSGAMAFRSHVGLTLRQGAPGKGSWFLSARYRSTRGGSWELWSNVGRMVRNRVEYWYLYLENQQCLHDTITGIVKLGRSYSRERDLRSVWTLVLGLKAAI